MLRIQASIKPKGFSIAEILVALSIIAILSAVLIPTLGGHIRRSDAGRISSDLTAMQSAIHAFAEDVHRYPGSVTDLLVAIDGSGFDVNGAPYPANLTPKWKGPYLERDPSTSLGVVGLNTSFGTLAGANAITYLKITLTSVSFKDFQTIEDILDSGTPSSTSSTLGVVRYSGTTLTYLAVPLL
jgi:prepilin-type N-terminal cleavage/methylation domain-containing protein